MYGPVKSGGLTWIEVVVVILVVLGFVLPILVPAYQRERLVSLNVECGMNLSGIGKAVLSYANDYNGELPSAGGKGTRWGPGLRSWSSHSRAEAFGLDPNSAGEEATISASLYLLIRHNGLSPKSFICPGDRRVTEFRAQKYGVTDRGLAELWDFGLDPARHCSYAYHVPYGAYAVTTSNEPSFAVAADRNPWMKSPSGNARPFTDFRPDAGAKGGTGTSDQARKGNAVGHQNNGQYVLFLDGHVEFAKRAYCGLDDDNIYTVSSSQAAGDPLGTPPKLGSQPANRKDSLLVNDPVVP
jgi:prepilin-type processing-associated H-X9-DG protein